jgi:hypothetical protein
MLCGCSLVATIKCAPAAFVARWGVHSSSLAALVAETLPLADHLTQLNHDLHSIGTIICQSCDLQPACHSSEKVLSSTVPCAALKGPYLFPRA